MNISTSVTARLAEKRSKVENLVRLQRLIKKLEFLFELPHRLNRSIELEAYAQAVKYFNMASGILQKHNEVTSFGAIQEESDKIMSQLKVTMRSKVDSKSEMMSATLISELIGLLISLGEPVEELMPKFYSCTRQIVGRHGEAAELVSACSDSASALNDGDDDNKEKEKEEQDG